MPIDRKSGHGRRRTYSFGQSFERAGKSARTQEIKAKQQAKARASVQPPSAGKERQILTGDRFNARKRTKPKPLKWIILVGVLALLLAILELATS